MKQRRQFLDNVKDKLFQRKDELQFEIEQLSKEKVSDQQVMDSADEALSLSMEKLQSSLQQTELEELKMINQALSRIEKGEYGICIDCAEQISQARLEYYPYAARCIICQEALES